MKFKTENLKLTWERKILTDLDRTLEILFGKNMVISYRDNTFIFDDGRSVHVEQLNVFSHEEKS